MEKQKNTKKLFESTKKWVFYCIGVKNIFVKSPKLGIIK